MVITDKGDHVFRAPLPSMVAAIRAAIATTIPVAVETYDVGFKTRVFP